MMKLKKNSPQFQVADGPMAGRTYRHGEIYREDLVPQDKQGLFETVGPKKKAAGKKQDAPLVEQEATDK